MNISNLHSDFLKSSGIATDTRKIRENSIFFALKGENFDGNNYAEDALNKGAKLAVVDDKDLQGKGYFYCKDVLTCLQELANYHRRFLNLPILAITGSNGKTTTKKLVLNVLQQKLKAVATKGNLNNHIGVPLTLLSFNEGTEIGIVEMGANHQKEIQALCKIAEPNFGYITNYGKAHLEGFGGVEGVIKGKSEMYSFISNNNGLAFVNAEDSIQLSKTKNMKRFTIGEKNADCIVNCLQTHPKLKIKYQNTTIKSELFGSYNFKNVAAAVGIAEYFKLSFSEIKKGIESFTTEEYRSQFIQTEKNTILMDAYNANPTSMEAALRNFEAIKAKQKMLILGDMFEIGKDAIKEHEFIIQLTKELKFDTILVCGHTFFDANKNLKNIVSAFKNFDDLKIHLQENVITNFHILLKGSRGMALERCLVDL